MIRKSLIELQERITFLGNDINEKDIDLRQILMEFLYLIDQALPMEVEQD